MTLADKVTSLRLVLAPVFVVVYLLPRFFSSIIQGSMAWTVPVLWVLFVVAELTDCLDGMVARKRGEVSDFGKLYDPFADTLTQVSLFFCFVVDGILPALLFLLVLYREFGILFLRNLMLRKGVALGARMGGKIKTVTYIAAAGLALMASSAVRLGVDPEAPACRVLTGLACGVFALAVLLAVVSFFDYLAIFRKRR